MVNDSLNTARTAAEFIVQLLERSAGVKVAKLHPPDRPVAFDLTSQLHSH